MAITITQEPQKYTPSDNPIVFVFKQPLTISANTKYNVSFVVKTFVNGAEIGTFEVFPELTTSDHYAKIDLSDKVRAYINNHSIYSGVNFVYDPQNYAVVNVVVYEKYSTDPNITATTQVSGTTSVNVFAFKGSLSRSEFKSWDYTPFKKGNFAKRFLTTKDYITFGGAVIYSATEKKGGTTILSWLDNSDLDTPSTYEVIFEYLLPSGNVTQITSFDSFSQGGIGALRFNLDEQLDLTNITQSTYDNCTGVNISIKTILDASLMGVYRITFSDACFDKGANLIWLNKFGSYDNYRFTYNSRISAKIESKSFSKIQGEWSGNTYNVNNNTFGKIDYLKTITKQLELSSDWLDESTQNWLVQLYESPLVYLNEGTDVENVVITDSSYQLKQSEHDELFNEIVNIEFTDYKSISL